MKLPAPLVPLVQAALQAVAPAAAGAVASDGEVDLSALAGATYSEAEVRTRLTPPFTIDVVDALKPAAPSGLVQLLGPAIVLRGPKGERILSSDGLAPPPEAGTFAFLGLAAGVSGALVALGVGLGAALTKREEDERGALVVALGFGGAVAFLALAAGALLAARAGALVQAEEAQRRAQEAEAQAQAAPAEALVKLFGRLFSQGQAQ